MTPTADPIVTARLREHFKFKSWQNRNRLGRELFIKNFHVQRSDLPGWAVQRVQPLRFPQWPATCRVLWRPAQPHLSAPLRTSDKTEPLLQLDIYECTSRVHAHEFLLRLLAEFQLPGMSLREEAAAGDVLFGNPTGQVALFARGNVAVLLRNSGLSLLPIAALTNSFDQSLTREPEPSSLMEIRAPRTRAAAASKVHLGSKTALPLPVPLTQDVPRPASGTSIEPGAEVVPMLKIFAQRGKLLEEDEKIVYQATASGVQEVVMFAIFPNGTATASRVRYTVA
jgi:hypothetical protein